MRNTLLPALFCTSAIALAVALVYSTSERVTAQDDLKPAMEAPAATSSVNKGEVEAIVKQFILNNPEVMIESMENYQKRMYQEEMARRAGAFDRNKEALINDPDSPMAGNPKGDVTVVEFFDYNCGYCKSMREALEELLAEDKNVKVVFKEFPILTRKLPTDFSRVAAKGSLAMYRLKPEKYFEYHTAIMNYAGRVTEEALIALAEPLGVSGDTLKAEMAKPEIEAELKQTDILASELGVSGTPALVINGEVVPGAIKIDALKAKVAAARNK